MASAPLMPTPTTAAAVTALAGRDLVGRDLADPDLLAPDPLLAPLTGSDSVDLRPAELRATLPATPTQTGASPILHQVAHRLAALPGLPDRDAPLELTLDPPELGSIRVSVSRGAEGLVLHLHADLPDTLELLRRHGGTLMQELQRQGLDHTGFSFSGQQDDRRQTSATTLAPQLSDEPADSLPADPITPAPVRFQTGLDLRL